MKKLKFAMGACFFCVGFSVLAQNAQAPNDDAAQAALQQRLLDQEVAPIRSQVGLQEYLRFLPAQSPLKALSPAARARFLNSLVFSKMAWRAIHTRIWRPS